MEEGGEGQIHAVGALVRNGRALGGGHVLGRTLARASMEQASDFRAGRSVVRLNLHTRGTQA